MLKKFTWEEEDADAVQSFRRNDIINNYGSFTRGVRSGRQSNIEHCRLVSIKIPQVASLGHFGRS